MGRGEDARVHNHGGNHASTACVKIVAGVREDAKGEKWREKAGEEG